MPTEKITKRSVDAAQPGDVERFLWDTELAGFGLRVWPSGRKTFVAQFRVSGGRNGRGRRMTVGTYPTLTVDEARVQARSYLARAMLGDDPAKDRDRARAAETVNDLVDLWLKEAAHRNRRTGAERSPSSVNDEKGRIEAHVRPLIGGRRLIELGRSDVEKFRDQVTRGDSKGDRRTKSRGVARVRGGNGAATRTVRLLSSIFAFGVDQGLLLDNPVRGVRLTPGKPKNRFLSEVELQRLGLTLATMEQEGCHPFPVAVIRLLALTGARRNEITALKWSEVDFDNSMLRLRTSKTGAKTIPLAPPAKEILIGLPRMEGASFLFPAASGGGHIQNVGRVWSTIRGRADLKDVRLHDLRHTFASFGAARGFGLPVIGALLGHHQMSTTQRYAHLADDPVRAAADRIGGTIAAAMSRITVPDKSASA